MIVSFAVSTLGIDVSSGSVIGELILRSGIKPGDYADYAIAIPAQNEQARIAACLDACSRAVQCHDGYGVVVLLVNNTTDDTVAIAVRWATDNCLPIEIIYADLPPEMTHAGAARRLALDRARSLVRHGGALLTTDADSLPTSSWVLDNLGEIAAHDALICGRIEFDSAEMLQLPLGTLETGTSETFYKSVAAELDSLIDPDPHNPWPHHGQVSGASLGMSARAYDLVGGVPPIVCGEDRALARAFRSHGLPVRHSAQPRVITSCRLDGRAAGGMADTIALRRTQDNYICDDTLEPADDICRRASLRAELREVFANGLIGKVLADFRLSDGISQRAQLSSSFVALWALLERESPVLARKRMRRREMEAQTPRLLALRDRHLGMAFTLNASRLVDVA